MDEATKANITTNPETSVSGLIVMKRLRSLENSGHIERLIEVYVLIILVKIVAKVDLLTVAKYHIKYLSSARDVVKEE